MLLSLNATAWASSIQWGITLRWMVMATGYGRRQKALRPPQGPFTVRLTQVLFDPTLEVFFFPVSLG